MKFRASNNPTINALSKMLDDGELKTRYDWVLKRISEYKIGLSDCGKYLHEGEIMSANHLRIMLKRDFKNQFADSTNALANHIVNHAWGHCVKHANKQITLVPDGYREDFE